MKSLDYAEDLSTLWTQYKWQAEDYPDKAQETLRNIVAHCEVAIQNGAEVGDYFGFHAARARQLLTKE